MATAIRNSRFTIESNSHDQCTIRQKETTDMTIISMRDLPTVDGMPTNDLKASVEWLCENDYGLKICDGKVQFKEPSPARQFIRLLDALFAESEEKLLQSAQKSIPKFEAIEDSQNLYNYHVYLSSLDEQDDVDVVEVLCARLYYIKCLLVRNHFEKARCEFLALPKSEAKTLLLGHPCKVALGFPFLTHDDKLTFLDLKKQNLDDPRSLFQEYIRLAQIFERNGQFEKKLRCWEKALKVKFSHKLFKDLEKEVPKERAAMCLSKCISSLPPDLVKYYRLPSSDQDSLGPIHDFASEKVSGDALLAHIDASPFFHIGLSLDQFVNYCFFPKFSDEMPCLRDKCVSVTDIPLTKGGLKDFIKLKYIRRIRIEDCHQVELIQALPQWKDLREVVIDLRICDEREQLVETLRSVLPSCHRLSKLSLRLNAPLKSSELGENLFQTIYELPNLNDLDIDECITSGQNSVEAFKAKKRHKAQR